MTEEQAPYNLSMTEQLRRARNFDELAEKIEPFAQSLAALADDCRTATNQTINHHQKSAEKLSRTLWESTNELLLLHQQNTKDAQQQTEQAQQVLNQAIAKIPKKSTNWWLVLACLVSGSVLGTLASWHWLKPSKGDLIDMRMGKDVWQMYQSEALSETQRKAIREVLEARGWNIPE